jgi:hypothetical protein
MNRSLWTVLALVFACCASAPAFALDLPTPQQQRMTDCNHRAEGKTGDERKAFMSACLKGETAEPNAQQRRMTDCNRQAGERKGDERKAFMGECLKGKTPAATPEQSQQEEQRRQDKIKSCNLDADSKRLKGAQREKAIEICLRAV